MVKIVLKGNISKVCEDLQNITTKSKANGITKVIDYLKLNKR